MNKCPHYHTHFEPWPDGGDIEICHDCGMSRHHWEQGESNWVKIDIPKARVEVAKGMEYPGKKLYYPETHFQGHISFEQDIKAGMIEGDLGIQVSGDGRVWICVDGKALIRLNPKVKNYTQTL